MATPWHVNKKPVRERTWLKITGSSVSINYFLLIEIEKCVDNGKCTKSSENTKKETSFSKETTSVTTCSGTPSVCKKEESKINIFTFKFNSN